jgi:hypothetical protein
MSRFEATVRHRDDVIIIDLRGDWTRRRTIHCATAMPRRPISTRAILLSFRSVGYITSTGIALVVDLLARAPETVAR